MNISLGIHIGRRKGWGSSTPASNVLLDENGLPLLDELGNNLLDET